MKESVEWDIELDLCRVNSKEGVRQLTLFDPWADGIPTPTRACDWVPFRSTAKLSDINSASDAFLRILPSEWVVHVG